MNDRCERTVFRVEAEKNRDWVECVAQHAGEREQSDVGRVCRDVLGLEKGFEIRTESPRVELEVVFVAERVEIRFLRAEERDGAGERGDFVEVDEEEENPVNEFVVLGLQAPVHDGALVEAGCRSGHRARSGVRTAARSTAEL